MRGDDIASSDDEGRLSFWFHRFESSGLAMNSRLLRLRPDEEEGLPPRRLVNPVSAHWKGKSGGITLKEGRCSYYRQDLKRTSQ